MPNVQVNRERIAEHDEESLTTLSCECWLIEAEAHCGSEEVEYYTRYALYLRRGEGWVLRGDTIDR